MNLGLIYEMAATGPVRGPVSRRFWRKRRRRQYANIIPKVKQELVTLQ